MYFSTKNYLKSNHNHTTKLILSVFGGALIANFYMEPNIKRKCVWK